MGKLVCGGERLSCTISTGRKYRISKGGMEGKGVFSVLGSPVMTYFSKEKRSLRPKIDTVNLK
jgi:hypothetical protein